MASMDTVEENTKFAAEHGGGFPILCDPEKKTLAAYGVLHERGFANRWTFYIDKEGIIKRIDKKVKFGSAGADMVAAMGELDFPKAD